MSKYIDADELRQQRPEYLDEENDNRDRAEHAKGWNACNKYWIDILREMPAADVEPVEHGEWKPEIGYDPRKAVQCSNCRLMNYEPTEYCPHCGAKMQFMGGDEGC